MSFAPAVNEPVILDHYHKTRIVKCWGLSQTKPTHLHLDPSQATISYFHSSLNMAVWPRNDLRKQAFQAFFQQNSSQFTDATICCEDGQGLRVHKIVLVASSPFLANIFCNIPVAEDDFTIFLPDFSLETVKQFFDLVYKGECVPGRLEDDHVKVATALGINQIKGKTEPDNQEEHSDEQNPSKVRCKMRIF